jgi:hypothetical protein
MRICSGPDECAAGGITGAAAILTQINRICKAPGFTKSQWPEAGYSASPLRGIIQFDVLLFA